MRRGVRGLVVVGLAAGLTLTGLPAFAAEEPGAPVSLVVGLRDGADTDAPADRLTDRTDVDVLDTEPVAADSAVTVDVASDEVAEAAAALRTDPNVAYVELDRVATAAAVVPDDPYFDEQWGTELAEVDEAWETTTGSSAVTVAVVDTGVRTGGDLSGRVLTGYDFVNGDSNATDDQGHGTMVASVLASLGDNDAGTAGVCWACRILPVKVLGADGSGYYTDIADGIVYAADRGAEIINLSLGGSDDSQLLRDAVSYAVGKGSLVIAAAGNSGVTDRHYPAAISTVLAVGASTESDTRYGWSNYGSGWVDIAAPGCNPAQGTNRLIGEFCGTSSATPFVSGVAALLASVSPAPTAAQIRSALTNSAADLNWGWTAAGRVDADAALRALSFWLPGVSTGTALRGTSATLRPHVSAYSGITEVTATLNGDTVGTVTGSPWNLVLDTSGVDAGPATLVVTARAGETVQSTLTRQVVIDRVAPATSFRYPAASALVRDDVTIGVNAYDAVGLRKVQLLLGSRVVATDYAAPFALRWNSGVRNGSTVLTLRTYDRAGNVTEVDRTVVADNWGPSVLVTAAPAGGTRGIRGTKRFAVRAADGNGVRNVELLVDGRVVSRHEGASHTFGVDTSRYGRRMTVRARAYDRAGNVRYTPIRTWYR
ncbi:MAG TPA: S8 family serine peptidase [Actinoplanes sp.]|nr:S8 family serine peptidase [Actinoplanes sp.]